MECCVSHGGRALCQQRLVMLDAVDVTGTWRMGPCALELSFQATTPSPPQRQVPGGEASLRQGCAERVCFYFLPETTF